MQICKAHWDRLRQAVIDKGMGHLISNTEQAVNKIKKELNGELAIHEPLLIAVKILINYRQLPDNFQMQKKIIYADTV
jgi:hypothetical protein